MFGPLPLMRGNREQAHSSLRLSPNVPVTDAMEKNFVASVEYHPGTECGDGNMDNHRAGMAPKDWSLRSQSS